MTDVLVCNAGSTSLKFALYRFPEAQRVFGMKIGGIGRRDAEVFCRREDTAHRYCFFSDVQDYRAGVELFFATLAEEGIAVSSPLFVGFKTVFAQGYHGTHVIDDDVMGRWNADLRWRPRTTGRISTSSACSAACFPPPCSSGRSRRNFT